MAVAMRRPGFTLWLAWVGAGALGAAVAASASQPGNEVFGEPGASYWAPIVLAVPLALFQFLVLVRLVGVSVVHAGMWIGVTLVASAAGVFATSGWLFVAPEPLTRMFGVDTGMNIVFTVGDYMNPLLLGLAQGVVLAWVFGRPRNAVLWVAISVAAFAVSIRLTIFAMTASGFDLQTVSDGYVLPRVVFAALYAAVTGLALVAMVKMRPRVSAPSLPHPAV